MTNDSKRCETCQELLKVELQSSICQNCAEKSPKVLIENQDYYVEKGLFVFTEKYHLDRGYCCNSGCRHCPY